MQISIQLLMKSTNASLLVLVIFCQCVIGQNASTAVSTTTFYRQKYKPVATGSVKPTGWLLNQLQIMRDGSTGHLDEYYSKLKNDNGWLGGRGDNWEETPYWLDGAVPLAWILDDKNLQLKVLKYINWTIDNQRPSGYFGPITKAERDSGVTINPGNCEQGQDWWPKMVMLKVLQQYYSATNDNRVLPFMSKYFRYQLSSLKKCTIGNWTEWAESRGHDNVLVVQWLYGITKENFLLELAGLINSQTFSWSNWLGNRDWVINAAAYQNNEKWMSRHGVNVGMALKDPAVHYQRTGHEKYLKDIKTGFHDLMTLHGLPMGIFSADEDLHGNDPTQGAELCAIVEAMFSLEQIIAITGDIYYMDALERMTFNALPSQTTDDYNSKQYFQIANQVHVKKGVFNFSLPFDREMNNVFGARSGYTCCLANMHQGWTKFATHLWYETPEKGLAALHYSPNRIVSKLGASGTEVSILENTNYPFDDLIDFQISTKQDVSFPFELRIPSWCKEAIVSINGKKLQQAKGGTIVKLKRTWKNGDKLTLQLPMEVSTSNWGRNSRAVERGPLVYALKLEEIWEKGIDEREGEYFTVYPKSSWNFGLLHSVVDDAIKNLEVKFIKPITSDFVWNLANAPIEILAPAKKIPGWQIVNDVAPQPVTDRTGIYKGKVSDTVEKITLVPFGCTKVRIVAFPVVK